MTTARTIRITLALFLAVCLAPLSTLAQDDTPIILDPVVEASPAEQARLDYNEGLTLARTGAYTAAQPLFQSALETERPDLQLDAHINLGNTYFGAANQHEATEAFEDAITAMGSSLDAYKNALLLDPADPTSKRNFELALGNTARLEALLKNQQEEEQQDKPPEEDQENDDSQEKEDSDDTEDKQDQNNEDENEENQDDTSEREEGNQEQNDDPSDSETKDESESGSDDEQNQSPGAPEPSDDDSTQDGPQKNDDPKDRGENDSQPGQPQNGEANPVNLTPDEFARLLQQLERDEKDAREAIQLRLQGGASRKPLKNW